jgi:hypothetical protein
MKNIAAIRCHTFKQHVILHSGDKDTCLDNKPYEMIMNKEGGGDRGEERGGNIDI